MLREYVIGEAMNSLGIRTTRALAVVATGEQIAGRHAARCGTHSSRREPSAASGRSSTQQPTVIRRSCGASPTTPSSVTIPTQSSGEPVHCVLRGRRRCPGIAGGSLDARRVHPRCHEHRQHDDLRRDHRLRALRVHGCLRPRHRVQFDRSQRRYAYGNQPQIAQWNLARLPRHCCPCSTSARVRPLPRHRPCCSPSPPAITGTGVMGCVPSWVSAMPNAAMGADR